MTLTELPLDRLEALEAKIDMLTDQMAILTADALHRRQQQEAFSELTTDLARVSEGAMDMATRELQALSETADLTDTVRLLRRLVEVAPTLERALVGLSAAGEFVDEVAPLGTDVMTLLTDRLDTAERTGWFRFGAAAVGVAERVVTTFDEDDVQRLGDNVVAMLEALREITQPDMLVFLGRMVAAVEAEQQAVENEPVDPPSLWALARQVRDPDVRRGMARALHTLGTVSSETGTRHDPNTEGGQK